MFADIFTGVPKERLESPTFSDHRPVRPSSASRISNAKQHLCRLCMQICIFEMSLDDLRRVCAEFELKRSAAPGSAALTCGASRYRACLMLSFTVV